MTVAAMSWVFKQNLPPPSKLLLLSLADQADDETGRVCYGRTDIDHIGRKASLPRRSVFRHIGALILNGYMAKESGATKGAPNTYWLQLDRAATPLEDWTWYEEPDREDNSEEGEGATVAPPQSDGNAAADASTNPPVIENGGCHHGTPGVPYVAHKESSVDQSTKDSQTKNPSAVTESGFSKKNQQEERSKAVTEREKAKPAQYFVIEGSDPWKYWIAEMRRRTGRAWHLTTDRVMDGRSRRGWYFPSLYPPSSVQKPKGANGGTGPPGELSDEDARVLAGM